MSNKNRNYISQIAHKESRTRFYAMMFKDLADTKPPSISEAGPPQPEAEDGDNMLSDANERYWMPKTYAGSRDLTRWLAENQTDPALRVSPQVPWPLSPDTNACLQKEFRPRLFDHLLARIRGVSYDGDEHQYSNLDRDSIIIDQNRIYEHKVIRFKSTTYDARRMEESANPRTHADIMVLSHEDGIEGQQGFPYWHARIVGIYHFMVRERTGGAGLSPPSRIDVLFVRWFGFDSPDGQSGWRARQLHKVGFLPDTNLHGPAFGFLDPTQVIRMVHLIPDFSSIRTKGLLTGQSMANQNPHPEGEIPVYYVAM